MQLPSENLDQLSTPSEWNIENYRKSLIVRTKAVVIRKSFSTAPNPFMWLNSVIDNVIDASDSVAYVNFLCFKALMKSFILSIY